MLHWSMASWQPRLPQMFNMVGLYENSRGELSYNADPENSTVSNNAPKHYPGSVHRQEV